MGCDTEDEDGYVTWDDALLENEDNQYGIVGYSSRRTVSCNW